MPWDNITLSLHSKNFKACFHTGDVITGYLVLQFSQRQRIEYVNFQVIGVSEAQWTRPMPTMPFIKIYSEKYKVLDVKLDIFRELEGKVISSGLYTFNFHFLLPEDLPNTFQSSIAKVHYFVQIKGKANYRFKKVKIVPFSVERYVNLNGIQDFLVPSSTKVYKKFWNSQKFSLSLVTYKGFGFDQNVPMKIEIENDNQTIISKLNVALIQQLEYSVASGYANEEKNVYRVKYEQFLNCKKENISFLMQIPHTLPSSINVSNHMINISYVLRVSVVFRFHSTLYHDIPVTIASVPVLRHGMD